jgi:hypothetical protein
VHTLIPSLVLSTWREVLYEEVKVDDPGSPVVILILSAALQFVVLVFLCEALGL